MKLWFQARDYPKHLVQKEMSKVRFYKENSNTKQSESKRGTFVVTCHPLLLHITLCCYISPFVVTCHPLLLHITLC